MGQGGNDFTLNRDPMRVNPNVECLAEDDCVFSALVCVHRLVVEPEMEFVKKMKAR